MIKDWAVGDKVIIKKKATHNRKAYWTLTCEQYAGKTVTIRTISSRTYVTFKEEPTVNFLVDDIEGYADPTLEKERLESIRERVEAAVYTEDKIRMLAESVFDKERVWVYSELYGEDNTHIYICIHFPKIDVTNSMRRKHTIRDLYVQFRVRKINMERVYSNVCAIDFLGTRTTLVLKEYVSYYSHSHLPARGFDDEFKSFCLGSSAFGTIISDLCMDLSEENWMLLFLSLENYLKWESIEGGPHIRMTNISVGGSYLDTSIAAAEVARIIKDMPINIWDFDGKNFKIINRERHFIEYLDKFFPIRESRGDLSKIKMDYMTLEANKYLERYPMKWKDISIPRVVISEEEPKKTTYKPIAMEVVDVVQKVLNREINNFIKNTRHEKTKETQRGKVFYDDDCCSLRKDGALEQANTSDIKEVEKAD